jgi:hypothetical protein
MSQPTITIISDGCLIGEIALDPGRDRTILSNFGRGKDT